MTELYNLSRKLLLAFTGAAAFSASGISQTVLIDPAGDGGFETGTTFAANGWQTAQQAGANKKWYVGTGQTGFTGARAAFIGNSATNVGNNGAARTVHLYKTIAVPAGATNIQLSFKYKQALADNTYDYLAVSATTATPVNGQQLSSGLVMTVDPVEDTDYATFTTVTASIPSALVAGYSANLVFTFICDDIFATFGAVDDVSLTYTPGVTLCAGTPVAGTIAPHAPVCTAQNLNLFLSGHSNDLGTAYQWQSSADGATFTDIAGATFANLSSVQTAAAYYRVNVTCSASALTSTSNVVFVNQMAGCYCTASAQDGTYEVIDRVSLGTINNTSFGTTGYESFTSLSTTLEKGAVQTITIESDYSYDQDQVVVFIDYNQDGDFADAGETVYTSALQESPYTGTFTVPFTAVNGLTRMRIRFHDTGSTPNATSCGTSEYGDVEDYMVTIVCPVIAAPVAAGDLICSGETASLTATAPGGADFNWYTSAAGATAAGSGSPFVTPVINATTSYFVEANISGCASTRTEAIVTVSTPTPVITAGGPLVTCGGSSVVLTASSATGNVWSTTATTASITVNAAGSYTVTETNADGCTATSAPVVITAGTVPTVDGGADQAVCAGESVALTATGTGIMTWDNGVSQAMPFTPAATTTYTVTVDNGTCTATDEVTVTVNTIPTANAGADQTVCEGESVSLTATGTGTFTWDNSISQATPFTPAATTTYTVTVDNGNCTATDEVTVTVNPLPAIDGGADQVVCAGESVALTATGAGIMTWDNGVSQATPFTPTVTTTYTVTVDNGTCTATDEVTVTVNLLPAANAGVDQAICAGASVVLTATGTGTFTWDNGVSQATPFIPAVTTTYTVTVDNGTCTADDEVTVTVNTTPVATAVLSGVSLLTASPAGQSYQWLNCATNAPIAGATGATFIATANGSYKVIVENGSGCSDTSACVNVTALSLDEAALSGMVLFPNPTNGNVTVTAADLQGSAVVYDAQGKLVLSAGAVENGSVIDLSAMTPGVYTVVISTEKGIFQNRIVKN